MSDKQKKWSTACRNVSEDANSTRQRDILRYLVSRNVGPTVHKQGLGSWEKRNDLMSEKAHIDAAVVPRNMRDYMQLNVVKLDPLSFGVSSHEAH